MDQMFEVKNKRLHLSRMVEWQFNNLNASFEKVMGTSKRTVMVYSDLVESTVVGSGKFPLLREVQLLRTGEGESTMEPLHHQWIKVRGNQLEILEAVSYTHLRAHETDSYLVCRLLLEKKNEIF